MSVFTIHYRSAPAVGVPSLLQRAAVSLRHAVTVQRTRLMLAQMDDRMLSDIGLSRADAGHEVNRPIWDAGLR